MLGGPQENETVGEVIGLIGFGEVGQVLAKGMRERGFMVIASDPRFACESETLREVTDQLGVVKAKDIASMGAIVTSAFMLVPSGVSSEVVKEFSAHMRKGTKFFDFSTSSPSQKKESAFHITGAGGTYTDVSIMGTVASEGFKVPLLMAGPEAEAVNELFVELGLNAKVLSSEVGAAASVKMLRSIFMKGIEALIFETMLTAEQYGVRDEVMASVASTFEKNEFKDLAETLMKTHILHRERRKKEVEECMALMRDAGLKPLVTEGVVHFFEASVANRNELDTVDKIEDVLKREYERMKVQLVKE